MSSKFKILSFIGVFTLLCTWSFGQNIENTWILESKVSHEAEQEIDVGADSLLLVDGDFFYSLSTQPYPVASGSYILQNESLILLHQKPTDTFERFVIVNLTASSLELRSNQNTYRFALEPSKESPIADKELIPSSGFTSRGLLKGMIGMTTLLFIAFLFSSNRRGIRWKTVVIGLSAQLLLAIGVLKVPFIQNSFEFVGKIFVKILDFTLAGSEFLLGDMVNVETFGFIFLFQVLPTIIFFSAITSVLFYLGIIQKVVKGLAWVLTKLLGISGAESLSVAGNIFLGQTEAPLMIKAYLEKMSKSEMLLVMVGGMATVAGGVLAAYIGFLGGEDEALRIFYAKHLLTASVMAAPGAIVIAKILYPETAEINNEIEVSTDQIGSNILDAIANGTTEGLKLAANVGAMLLVFIAFIAMLNFGFEKIGDITNLNSWVAETTPYEKFSLEFILGYIFAPLMWLIGVAHEDMALMGQLLGIKIVASEFVGYIQLAD
ncbi:MAG: Na+ dependent nucleoside transporter, partial [Saprospirales bacterium]